VRILTYVTAPANPNSTPTGPREVPLIIRLVRVLLVMSGVVAGVVVVVATGAVALPGGHNSSQRSASLAAQRTAANRQWATTLCTNLGAWKDELHRDATSLDLGFGPVARLRDATAATKRMLRILDKLGPPPAGGTSQGRGTIHRLRAQLQSTPYNLERLAETRTCRQIIGIPL
jgi:hypothetical protein